MDRSEKLAVGMMVAACATMLLFSLLPAPLEAAGLLAVGWLRLASRVAPGVVMRGDVVAVGLLGLIGGGVAVHRFCGWVLARLQGAEGWVVWKVRWTVGVVGAGACLVVGGIAGASGLAQLSRMLDADERWVMGAGHRRNRLIQSASNLRQIGLGLMQYANVMGRFPPGATFDADGTPLHGWPTLILPYVDNVELSDAINLARPWDDDRKRGEKSNKASTATGIGIYRNPGVIPDLPAEYQFAFLGYATNAWVIGGDRSRRRNEITDGLAETILAGEAAGDYKPWGYPVHWRDPGLGINRVANGFGGPFAGGANFLFADGSVRFLKNSTSMPLFRALATPDGGERADLDRLE